VDIRPTDHDQVNAGPLLRRHGAGTSGRTPLPATASVRRCDWPSVTNDVGVVKQAVDSCRGESSRKDRVGPRRMQVRGHDERTLLISRVDEAIEGFGFVGASG
jgi:hypothetical protein